jgi:hypothetical protein
MEVTVMLNAFAIALGFLFAPAIVHAQSERSGEVSDGGLIALLGLLLGLAVLVGLTVKVIDRKRRREEEAVLVQAKVSDALLTDPTVGNLPVTVTAHVPFWSGSPVTVDVVGRVTRPDQREAVIRLVMREVEALRPDYRLVDRLAVEPAVVARAA